MIFDFNKDIFIILINIIIFLKKIIKYIFIFFNIFNNEVKEKKWIIFYIFKILVIKIIIYFTTNIDIY